jgi:hypothetical protein
MPLISSYVASLFVQHGWNHRRAIAAAIRKQLPCESKVLDNHIFKAFRSAVKLEKASRPHPDGVFKVAHEAIKILKKKEDKTR